jgi:hypothetical protein
MISLPVGGRCSEAVGVPVIVRHDDFGLPLIALGDFRRLAAQPLEVI